MKSDRKLIWVCPRNVIAESVYRSILCEISNVVENKLTVELYLSGEVQESHNHKSHGFESDIIVTNIDSFLKPSFDLSNSDKIIQILNCDIVFDEFHEFQTQVALFACFVFI
jgi:CRISPR/Cas system-associated endonuclease/helicase Cas3